MTTTATKNPSLATVTTPPVISKSPSASVPSPKPSSGEATKKWNPKVAYWKARKDNSGTAVVFEAGRDCFFMMAFPQVGEEKFDYNSRVIAKLGVNDVGEILAVLGRRIPGLGKRNDNGQFSGLYHQTDKANTIIGLSFDEEKNTFWCSISKKNKDDTGKGTRFAVSLSVGEATLLEAFFKRYIDILFEQEQPQQSSSDE